MHPFFILILAMAPWRPEYQQVLFDLRVIVHEYPYCDGIHRPGAWVSPEDYVIHLCPTPGDHWEWLGLHETQHVMAWTYLPEQNFDVFSRVAMKALRTQGYTDDQIVLAQSRISYGAAELHAELPWIVHGDIPSCLQRWYPWFDLSQSSGVASSEELAARAIGHGHPIRIS